MRHILAYAACVFALAVSSANQLSADPARATTPAALPVIELRTVYIAPPTPADFACTPYTCTEGGRRNPATNPEGDVFPTQLP